MADTWFDGIAHRHWLLAEGQRLLNHYARARVAGGFGLLDAKGALTSDRADTVATARMTHCYALASLMGVPGAGPLADHGIATLLDGPLRDTAHDGWFTAEGQTEGKASYAHAFVALAAASATIAKRPRARDLLEAVSATIDDHLWIEEEGVMAPDSAVDWSNREAYRGANANMHATEAFLALFDATGQTRWLERALCLVTRFVHEIAAPRGHLLPEHFDENWAVLEDFNRDAPTDALRPFGLTPGHHAEWAGLALKVQAGLHAVHRNTRTWLLSDAMALFDRAMDTGWAADGAPGIVYTLGWDGSVSVDSRAWWVQAEAANTAYLLFRGTGQPRFEAQYRQLWDYIAGTFIDHEGGGWRHEVDARGQSTGKVYPLRDDLYHAYQATLTPLLPPSASLAGALRRGLRG